MINITFMRGEELDQQGDKFGILRSICESDHDYRNRLISATLQPSGTEALVCADIANRQKLGIAKYGTTVAQNPLELRAWLQHALEEALDQAIYLKRAIQEIDNAR